MTESDDPETTFDEFWSAIVAPDGRWNLEQVKAELHDYKMLLDEVPAVYLHVTNGRISKPNTLASEVIGVHDNLFIDRRDLADECDQLDQDPEGPYE